MSFFSKRSTALVLTVVMVLASTLLSVNVKLGDKARDVTDEFYAVSDRGNNGNYRSLGSHLQNVCAYADGLVTIANNYGIDVEKVSDCSRYLKNAMTYSREEISYIFYCYSDLLKETDWLVDQLYRMELSERDADGLSQYETNLDGAKSAINTAADSYNGTVREFLRRYDRFPGNFLGKLAGVDMPDYFGA